MKRLAPAAIVLLVGGIIAFTPPSLRFETSTFDKSSVDRSVGTARSPNPQTQHTRAARDKVHTVPAEALAMADLSAVAWAKADTPIVQSDSIETPREKILICHRGKTIAVAPNSIAAHRLHGDTVGACNQ